MAWQERGHLQGLRYELREPDRATLNQEERQEIDPHKVLARSKSTEAQKRDERDESVYSEPQGGENPWEQDLETATVGNEQ